MTEVVMTRREMELPTWATTPTRGTGVMFRAEFLIPNKNIFVFVEKSYSKLSYFRKVQRLLEEKFRADETRIAEDRKLCIKEDKSGLKKYRYRIEERAVRYTAIFLVSKDGNVEQYMPNEKQQAKILRAELENTPGRVQVERLVNPHNASDICYVPLDVFEPIVEHYGGDKDRAARRWWRRELKRRNTLYR